ncbi:MAG: hypothetical protein ACRENP_25125 [Longimicrobiales bacterium]
MIATFLKYLVIGIAAIFAIGLAFTLLGFAFKVLVLAVPVALVGFVAYKIFGRKSSKQISDTDRKWLES